MTERPSDTEPVRLLDMLHADTVRARVAAATWQQATETVGRLLVNTGMVEPRYVEAMRRALEELGPYAVIAPGIALLHARPEDGVLAPCLALITLSEPVAFGNQQNDPVELVFALGAVDKSAHIGALQELSQMLIESDVLDQLRSAPDDWSLLATIRSALNAKGREN